MNYFNKLIPPRQLRIPLLGLLLIFGGVFAYRAKPVLSTQMEYLRTLTASHSDSHTYTWLQRNAAFNSQSIRQEAHLRKKLNYQSRLNTAHLGKILGSQFSLRTTRLRTKLGLQSSPKTTHHQKALAKSALPATNSSLIASNQPQTYTWLQRSAPVQAAKSQGSTTQTQILPKGNLPQQNGLYLYGQVPQPGQLGQGYIVFDKQQGKVVGALYIPGSEYSCFNGTLYPSGELAMTVKGYAGDSSPMQVATNNTLPKLSEDEPISYGHSVTLQDYYQLHSIGAKDRQILQMCKANLRG